MSKVLFTSVKTGETCFTCKTGYSSELKNADITATTTLQLKTKILSVYQLDKSYAYPWRIILPPAGAIKGGGG